MASSDDATELTNSKKEHGKKSRSKTRFLTVAAVNDDEARARRGGAGPVGPCDFHAYFESFSERLVNSNRCRPEPRQVPPANTNTNTNTSIGLPT